MTKYVLVCLYFGLHFCTSLIYMSLKTSWQCQFRRCQGSDYGHGLQHHVSTNHLAQIPPPCPFQGKRCRFVNVALYANFVYTDCSHEFHRQHGFEQHLRDDHANTVTDGDFVISVSVLKLSASPQPSSTYTVIELPPLEDQCIFALRAIPPRRVPVSPSPRCPPLQPRREECSYGYWGIPDRQEGMNAESRSRLNPRRRDKLSVLPTSDYIIRRKPPGAVPGLQLAHPVSYPPRVQQPPQAPLSIGYPTYRARVLAAHNMADEDDDDQGDIQGEVGASSSSSSVQN